MVNGYVNYLKLLIITGTAIGRGVTKDAFFRSLALILRLISMMGIGSAILRVFIIIMPRTFGKSIVFVFVIGRS